jgi:hypothetical protein
VEGDHFERLTLKDQTGGREKERNLGSTGLATALRAVERGADPQTKTPQAPVVVVVLDQFFALRPAGGSRRPAASPVVAAPLLSFSCPIFTA